MTMPSTDPRTYMATTPPLTAPTGRVRLPLHDELYLLAHDDETGAARIHLGSLGIGLAGAVLVRLLLERRVTLWDDRINVEMAAPQEDTIIAAAIANIRNGPMLPHVAAWLRAFGEIELYERIRANLVAVGILRRQTRRLRADTYPAVHHAWSVRVVARIRSVLNGYEQPDPQCAALCGLVNALGIHDHLSMAEPAAKVRHGLQVVASAHLPPVQYAMSCVVHVVGEQATAVYR